MKLKARVVIPWLAVIGVISLSILFVGAPRQQESNQQLLQNISDFELTSQADLERMVVEQNIDVSQINEKIAVFSSQLATLSDEDLEIASTILGRVSQAAAIVQTRYAKT